MSVACSLSSYPALCSAIFLFQLVIDYFQSVKKIFRNGILWKKLRKKKLYVVFNVYVSKSRKGLTVLMRGFYHISYTSFTSALFLYLNNRDNVKPIQKVYSWVCHLNLDRWPWLCNFSVFDFTNLLAFLNIVCLYLYIITVKFIQVPS